jgi:hypothetical protein
MENVPKLGLSPLPSPAASAHPDANLLTAFAEQSLAGRDRDHVVEHLARCGDCREVIALALPEIEEVLVPLPHAGRSANPGWFTWPVLRWSFVTAGMLAVTAIGVLQYRQRHEDKALVATNAVPPQLARAQNSAIAPAASGSPATASQTAAATRTATPKQPVVAPSALPAGPAVSIGGPSARSFNLHGNVGGVIGGGTFHGGGTVGRPSTTAALSSQPGESPESLPDESNAVGKAKPASAQALAPMAPAPWLRSDPTLMKGAGTVRWIIGDTGTLQRSADGGKTWQDVTVTVDTSMRARVKVSGESALLQAETSSEPAAEIKPQAQSEAQPEPSSEAKALAKQKKDYALPKVKAAAAAPAAAGTVFRALSVSSNASEVWAGGSAAILYHTLDGGNRWARVVPTDAGSALTGDIIGIEFTDALHGTVRTSTAEAWITPDDGQSWHKQQ